MERAGMHLNRAVVALAAKVARIVWDVLNKSGALYDAGALFSLEAVGSMQGTGQVTTKQRISWP